MKKGIASNGKEVVPAYVRWMKMSRRSGPTDNTIVMTAIRPRATAIGTPPRMTAQSESRIAATTIRERTG
jgi:hypothetical protein